MRHRLLTPWLIVPLLVLSIVAPQPGVSSQDDAPTGLPPPGGSSLALAPPVRHQADANRSATPQELPQNLRTKFEPALLKNLLDETIDKPLRGIVMMHEQDALRSLDLHGLDLAARRQAVVSHLKAVANVSQRNVLAILDAQAERQVVAYRPMWIVNGIAVQGSKALFWELAAHPDVSVILLDHVRYLPQAEAGPSLSPQQMRAQPDDVQWNIQRIQAHIVWQSLGLTGGGVVVANLDSGVDWQHPDLVARYRGYTGKPFAEHEGNWYCATDEAYSYPGDGFGHGTHTMGTIVGQNGLGVAPDAQWIAVKVFTNQGLALDSWIHDGFEWLLAPGGNPDLAPDIVNGSWGSKAGSDERFVPDLRALRAASILPVFSAGNEGPAEGSISSPASFPEAFAVGASDNQDQIARFSSRGPSPWKEIKPEVVAPGVEIVSTLPGGGWGVKNGTSMAAPHVAGVAALMLQANPTLTVEQTETILAATARPLGDTHPNNTFGWGLVDAYLASTWAGNYGQLAGTVTDRASGAAIPAATVQVVAHSGTATTTTSTDAAGTFRIGLRAGHYDASVTAFGYAREAVPGVQTVTGTTTILDVSMAALPSGLLRGVIRESGSGAALRAAILIPGSPVSATSNALDGTYSLSLPEGTHTIRIECAAHRIVTAQVTIERGAATVQDFELAPAPTILIVDGGAWYNDSQRQFYEESLDALGYLYDEHVIANVDIAPTDVPTSGTFLAYDLVLWSAPQDSPGFIGATAAITHLLEAGGRLLLSGQDVAFWDDGGSGLFSAPYIREYLKTYLVRDRAATHTLAGDRIFAGLAITIAGAGGADNQFAPDVIAVSDRDFAASSWTYQDDDGGSGGQAVGLCLPYRALVFGFGLEGINSPLDRQEVLQRSIDWLTAPPSLAGIELRVGDMPQVQRAGEWLTHTVRVRNTGQTTTDTLDLALTDHSWPTVLAKPAPVSLGVCQSVTLQISVNVPADTGWHVFDTAKLSARSTLSASLVETIDLLSKTPAAVLLVDGSRFYDVQSHYRDALNQAHIPFDTIKLKSKWPNIVPSASRLAMYPSVVWYTAYDWYEPISALEETRLVEYLNNGGRLMLSSQDLLYYRSGNTLAQGYLGVLDHVEDLGANQIWGQPQHAIGWGLGPYTLTFPYRNWSDSLTPVDGAAVVLVNEHAWPASIAHTGGQWRTLFMAFPFETLDPDAATEVIARTAGWLSWLGSSTWQADRRVIEGSDVVTMTCVLRNDGWTDLDSAHLAAVLPAELEMVDGSPSAGLTYDAPARTVRWQGGIARGASIAHSFQVVVDPALLDPAYISFPARIGYDEHQIAFDRPFILRANAPDLSLSTLDVDPVSSPPNRSLSYTLTVRNGGVRAATAHVSATIPSQTALVGPLESGGIGSWRVISDVLAWTGPLASGSQVTLNYRLMLDNSGDYALRHLAFVSDQYGERWTVDARTEVWLWRSYFPWVRK